MDRDALAKALAIACHAVCNGDSLSAMALADLMEELGFDALASSVRENKPVASKAMFRIKVGASSYERRIVGNMVRVADPYSPDGSRWARGRRAMVRVERPERVIEVVADIAGAVQRVVHAATYNAGGKSEWVFCSARTLGKGSLDKETEIAAADSPRPAPAS